MRLNIKAAEIVPQPRTIGGGVVSFAFLGRMMQKAAATPEANPHIKAEKEIDRWVKSPAVMQQNTPSKAKKKEIKSVPFGRTCWKATAPMTINSGERYCRMVAIEALPSWVER